MKEEIIKGYCLSLRPDLLLPEEIKRYLSTKEIGQIIEHFRIIDSTNRRAKELALEGAPQGTVVVAEEQTGGRGRVSNRWFSPRGGIWFSVILTPDIDPQQASFVTLLASLAVVRGIQELVPLPLKIKWPNDVYLKNRKCAGILTEISAKMNLINYIVLGIGINIKIDSDSIPGELKKKIICLGDETETELFFSEILAKVLRQIELLYDQALGEGFGKIIDEWRKYDLLLGRQISVETPLEVISGQSIGINEKGALLLKTEQGQIIEVLAGSIIFK
ncbi:biotin--[acetyl-CoA-carboxylase] ligase [Candidatus Contubernalis alkaliaceticus]|uniref:biotin--[acetyl-CoA-carboxylase] ligase n=1 Tax=Candidatus Contubernalis alkaliaceticus TaxID=338645 RepID=UPI001F4C4F0F|nr:biotin--[acetyl-CoA-carboxylase] ligase [Candidatus Contubernalis alkalaceticus]UNC90722.1 biotin--[acetyl-CoA-carboxylase] ligase [Candidatus Contubernalis alkalaceticus]